MGGAESRAVHLAERRRDLVEAGRPGRRVLGEAPAQQLADPGGHLRHPGVLGAAAPQERRQRFPGDLSTGGEAASGEHLQDAHRPGPHVGRRGQPGRAAPRARRRLFRGAVGGCHPGVRRGQRVAGRGLRRLRPVRRRSPGQAEVGDLRRAVRLEHHVRRFDVLMDQPAVVCVRQPPGHLHGDVQDAAERGPVAALVQPAAAYGLRQAAAVDPLGEHPGQPVDGAHVHAVDGVRMEPESDPGARLVLEPPPVVRRPHPVGARGLHGEVHLPVAVPDPVHQAHPAVAHHVEDLVQPEDGVAGRPDTGGSACHGGLSRRGRVATAAGRPPRRRREGSSAAASGRPSPI